MLPTDRSVDRITNMTVHDRDAVHSEGRASEVYRTAAEIILQKGYDATSVSDGSRRTAKCGLGASIQFKVNCHHNCPTYTWKCVAPVSIPRNSEADAAYSVNFI